MDKDLHLQLGAPKGIRIWYDKGSGTTHIFTQCVSRRLRTVALALWLIMFFVILPVTEYITDWNIRCVLSLGEYLGVSPSALSVIYIVSFGIYGLLLAVGLSVGLRTFRVKFCFDASTLSRAGFTKKVWPKECIRRVFRERDTIWIEQSNSDIGRESIADKRSGFTEAELDWLSRFLETHISGQACDEAK